jgi:hypothetical protein
MTGEERPRWPMRFRGGETVSDARACGGWRRSNGAGGPLAPSGVKGGHGTSRLSREVLAYMYEVFERTEG